MIGETCFWNEHEVLIHVFECEDDEVTSRYHACLCGEATWGEMDDLLALHTMWEHS